MKPYKILLFSSLVLGVLTMTFLGCQKEAQKTPTTASNASSLTIAGALDRNSNLCKNQSSGKEASAYDTLTLTCAGGTQSTLAVTVTAGATGAPAGFSIQWMPKAAFDANNGVWPDDGGYCEASLSGVPLCKKNTGQSGANLYDLAANGSVTVYIGDLLNAQLNQQLGLSTSCSDALTCGTQYVFRAFAHGNSTKGKSGFSYLTSSCATTASCGGGSTK